MSANLICAVCGAKSALSLCPRHITELRTMLESLTGEYRPNGKSTAGWLENLADACHGQTRMGGDGGRRSGTDSEAPIRFNEKASELAVLVRGTLARWIQEMMETRGMAYNPVRFVRDDYIGPLQLGTLRGLRYADNGAHLAWWLLIYIDAIVVSGDAGMFFDEIHNVIEEIKRRVDRPETPREVGCCMTIMEDEKECGYYLLAPRDAIEVTCPECETTWNIEKLTEKSLDRANHMSWTADVIMQWIERGGLTLTETTWRRWRKTGVVKPCLYQRGNDRRRIGITRQSDQDIPLYRLSDVRQAIATKGQHAKTRERAAG